MKDIFSDLYDKVLSFFTAQNEDESKSMAKNRLRTVLMQDRVGFSERAMQMLKDDMLETISRYLEIDVDTFDLSIDAADNTTILNLSIPVIRPRTDEEIDEAISIAQKEKIEKTQEIVGEIKELVKEKAQKLAEQMADQADDDSCENEEVQKTDDDSKDDIKDENCESESDEESIEDAEDDETDKEDSTDEKENKNSKNK